MKNSIKYKKINLLKYAFIYLLKIKLYFIEINK